MNAIFKKSLSVIITGALLLNSTVAYAEEGTGKRKAYDSLGTGGKALYTILLDAAKKVASGTSTSSFININSDIPFDDSEVVPSADGPFAAAIADVHDALLYDNPCDFYWYQTAAGMGQDVYYKSTNGTNYKLTSGSYFYFVVASDYGEGDSATTVDKTKIATATSVIENAKKIVEDAKNSGASDAERLQTYKNKICELASYDTFSADLSKDLEDEGAYVPEIAPWQLINVFDGDSSTKVVADGYAKAFQYLCDLDGSLTCYSVSGLANSEDHMWNIVSLEGQNYLVDLTNCDNGAISSSDGLFLKGMTEVVLGSSYSRTVDGKTFTYVYDDGVNNGSSSMAAFFGSDTLKLSDSNYGLPDAVSIDGATVVQSNTLTYDGSDKTPQFTVTLNGVKLSDSDFDVVVTAQKNAGKYTATINGKGSYTGSIQNVSWSIAKAVPTVDMFTFIKPANLTYDGAQKTAFVTSYKTGMGTITLKYSGTPINVGTYTVSINVAEGTNYTAVSGLSSNAWTFTISKAAASAVNNPTATAITYGQSLSASSLTGGWSWVDGTVVPTVNNGGYSAVKSVTDDDRYDYSAINGYNSNTHKITRNIALTVNKATPTVVVTANPSTSIAGKNVSIAATVKNPNNSNLSVGITPTFTYTVGENGAETPFSGSFTIPAGTANGTKIYVTAVTAENDNYTAGKDVTTILVTSCTHSGTKQLKYNSDAHWYECSNCGATDIDKTNHNGGTATCIAKAKCETCNSEYGVFNSSNHTNKATAYSSDETGHWYACDCGKADFSGHTSSGTATETTPETCTICNYVIAPATGHITHTADNSKWISDASGHWHKCVGCDEKVDFTSHTSSGAATETTAETCTICNYIITPATGHITHTADNSKWISDASGHWHKCVGCNEKIDSASHTSNNGVVTKEATETADGEKTYSCTVCNYVIKTETIPATGAEEPSDPVEAFVDRLYTIILGRNAEPAGLADWTNRLKTGTATSAEIVYGIANSPEFNNFGLSNDVIVEKMYQAMLGRPSDEGGKANWLNCLNSGMTVTGIINGFSGSQEFANICAEYGIQAGAITTCEARDKNNGLTLFVSRMYTKALNRPYDVAGLNDWTNRYLTGTAKVSDIAFGFIFSPEFVGKNLSNSDYVDTLYRTFFNREPDEGGKADWMNKLANGMPREEVLNGFVGSQECINLVATFGI